VKIKAPAFNVYGTRLDVYPVIPLREKPFPDKGTALSPLWDAKPLENT
jgi:hypothetical protein